jgi:hypothetical protein
MPARAELSAEMDAKPSEMDAKLVDDAEEDAPKKRMAEGVKFAPVTPSDKPTWSIETEPADAIIENPVRDVFVEAPEGYYVETSKGEKRGFKLVFAETPKDGAPQKQMLRFTLVRRLGQAEEFSARLDGAP